MATDNKLSSILEFLYKTSQYKNFFTKFHIEELITEIDKSEVGYNCSLITEQYTFNEVYELTGGMDGGVRFCITFLQDLN